MDKIELKVKKHDEFQIELKIACPIRGEIDTSNYYADVFFFLPKNLAINPQTYSSREFYNDLSEYIRFQTPEATLSDLTQKENELFQSLSASLDNDTESLEDCQKNLKMFCSIVRKTLKYSAEEIMKSSYNENCNAKIVNYLNDTEILFENFRNLRSSAEKNSDKLELFLLVDEFLSIALNSCLYKIWRVIKKNNDTFGEEIAAITERTNKEIEYRKNCNYLSIPDEKSDNSELLYRESILKKAMGSILFLNIATQKDGIWLENIFLGLAAAVAMIFVTAIAFIWKGLFLEEFSISFFVVWVIAYIFKDRIKAQLQLLCMNKRNRYAYDYQQKIFDGLNNEIGLCREGFQYCRTKDIPKDIEKIRNRTALSQLNNGSLNENVWVYRKKIEVKSKANQNIFKEFEIKGIVDIFRFNVRHWLNKMDNPTKIIYKSNGETIEPLTAHRDYHVNMVLRYGAKGGEINYKRYRIVLCRKGIRKIIHF